MSEFPWLRQYDVGVPHHVDVPDVPLQHFLEQAARRHPTHDAIAFFDHRLTYRDLLKASHACAAALHGLGVRPGSRVMLLLPNIPQAVICFYGALFAGATVVLSNPLAASAEIAHLLRDCAPEVIVTVGAALGPVQVARLEAMGTQNGAPAPHCVPIASRLILTRVREHMPAVRSRLIGLFGDRQGQAIVPADALQLSDLLRAHRDQSVPRREVDPDEVAVLAYTGGTTGMPRAVMLTHRNLVANTIQVRAFYAEAREGREVVLAALPFSHSYGLTACMSLGIYLGGCLVLLPSFRPGEALRAIAHHRPTMFPGVPAMYVSLINHPRVKAYPMHSIRACISGASPLPIEVKEGFERLTRGRLAEGYGLTEAGPATHSNPLGSGKKGTIGVPLPDTEARIVDPISGETLAPGEVGELVVRGPQIMKGYWGRPHETAQALRDGWLHTGDVASMDADGYFQIICRRQEVIQTGPHEVYPRDVEEVLYEHPKVREAAVVARTVDGAVCIEAHVVLRRDEVASPQEIIDFCRRRLSPHKIPALVAFQERLPRSAVGKILRRLL